MESRRPPEFPQGGTEAQNAERKSRGLPELDITGWIEPPRYDEGSHRLIWSLKAVDRRRRRERRGDRELQYLCPRPRWLLRDQPDDRLRPYRGRQSQGAEGSLSFTYNPGKRYEDFVAETDHVAEYGIAALVAGVAAKKLGLLAMAGLFFAKFAKIILVGLAVMGDGGWRNFFKRGSTSA